MELSSNFMNSVDLQNGVFEEEGAKMLEKWEKESSLMLMSSKEKSSSDYLNLNEPQKISRGNEDLEDQKRILAEREAAIYHLGSVMSNVFQGAFADADDAQKQFFKNAVIGLLDYLQKFIMEKKIEAVVSQLASKGFLGVITGAAIVGLIDGAFAVAKSQITGYAEGGLVLPEHGIPIQRDNGDNRLC